MADLLIVKNISREGPGLLQDILDENNISYDLIDEGEAIPSADGYKALIVYGGPDSANDKNPKMEKELAKVKQALDDGVPYLGICLGMQVLVKAAGGKVTKSPTKEVGFIDHQGNPYSVGFSQAGKQDPLLQGLDSQPQVFQLHGETVELTESMTLLASGKHCKNQIVRVGSNAYGIQSHFELTPEMLATWADEDPDLKPVGKKVLLDQYAAIEDEYVLTGRTFFTNFLKIAKLLT